MMTAPIVREPFELQTLPELFKKSALLRPHRKALRKKKDNIWREYDYGELLASITKITAFLIEKNVIKGDRIGILGENSPEWIITCMAIQWIAGIVVPLDIRSKTFEQEQIIQHSGMKILFADRKFIQPMENHFQGLFVCLDDSEVDLSVSDIVSTTGPVTTEPSTKLDDPAMILYTSGTTGNPKGVVLTHRNIASNINSMYQMVLFGEEDSFFSVLPISHAYEYTAGNLLPLTVGASITYSNLFKPKEMMEDLRDTEPTIMLAVPLLLEKFLTGVYKKIASSPQHVKGLFQCIKTCAVSLNFIRSGYGGRLFYKRLRRKIGFGKLRFFASGGAQLSPKLQHGMEELGFTIIQGYGLTETSPVVTLTPPSHTKAGSVGLPLPGVDVGIEDKNNDGIGEIVVQGPNVMKGYYRNKEATMNTLLADGSLLTGDLGYIDNEGFLFITGRRKSEIITRGGQNIYPEEVESIMLESPFINEILVVKGLNNRTGDEEVHAIIYPNHETLCECFEMKNIEDVSEECIVQILRQEIDERCRQLADYKKIRSFTVRNKEFPKTATNKIKRYLFDGNIKNKGKSG